MVWKKITPKLERVLDYEMYEFNFLKRPGGREAEEISINLRHNLSSSPHLPNDWRNRSFLVTSFGEQQDLQADDFTYTLISVVYKADDMSGERITLDYFDWINLGSPIKMREESTLSPS